MVTEASPCQTGWFFSLFHILRQYFEKWCSMNLVNKWSRSLQSDLCSTLKLGAKWRFFSDWWHQLICSHFNWTLLFHTEVLVENISNCRFSTILSLSTEVIIAIIQRPSFYRKYATPAFDSSFLQFLSWDMLQSLVREDINRKNVYFWALLVDRPTQLICQQTNTKDIVGQSARALPELNFTMCHDAHEDSSKSGPKLCQ